MRRSRLLIVLGGLSAVAPLGTDMYVPGLADVARDLRAEPWAIGLSLTGFLVGIVAGQLVLGPLSDRFGRRPLLLAGAAGFTATSALAALAPSVVWFDVLRVLQGFSGAAGLVIARAVITDQFDDRESARQFATLAALTAAAPIAAPLLGGLVLSIAPWRVVFIVLAVLGLLLTLGVAVWVPETRSPAPTQRTRAVFTDMAALGRRRRFAALALTLACGNAAIFAYIAGAPFLLAREGFTPAAISVVFGVNAAGNLAGALLFGHFATRARIQWVIGATLTVATSSTGALTVLAVTDRAPTVVVLVALLAAVTAFGVLFPAITTQAQNAGRHAPGSASALLGAGQFAIGAAASPLVGALGSTADATGSVMAACFILASAVYLLALSARPHPAAPDRRTGSTRDDPGIHPRR